MRSDTLIVALERRVMPIQHGILLVNCLQTWVLTLAPSLPQRTHMWPRDVLGYNWWGRGGHELKKGESSKNKKNPASFETLVEMKNTGLCFVEYAGTAQSNSEATLTAQRSKDEGRTATSGRGKAKSP